MSKFQYETVWEREDRLSQKEEQFQEKGKVLNPLYWPFVIFIGALPFFGGMLLARLHMTTVVTVDDYVVVNSFSVLPRVLDEPGRHFTGWRSPRVYPKFEHIPIEVITSKDMPSERRFEISLWIKLPEDNTKRACLDKFLKGKFSTLEYLITEFMTDWFEIKTVSMDTSYLYTDRSGFKDVMEKYVREMYSATMQFVYGVRIEKFSIHSITFSKMESPEPSIGETPNVIPSYSDGGTKKINRLFSYDPLKVKKEVIEIKRYIAIERERELEILKQKLKKAEWERDAAEAQLKILLEKVPE